MLELPKGIWRWIDANLKDIGRIADALETIAKEATEIRRLLESNEEKEQKQ